MSASVTSRSPTCSGIAAFISARRNGLAMTMIVDCAVCDEDLIEIMWRQITGP